MWDHHINKWWGRYVPCLATPVPKSAAGCDNGREPVLENLQTNTCFMRAVFLILRLKPALLAFFWSSLATLSPSCPAVATDEARRPRLAACGGSLRWLETCLEPTLACLLLICRSCVWLLESPGCSIAPLFPGTS